MSRASRRRARKKRLYSQNADNRRVDLHMHSCLSDGRLSPDELLKACIDGGLNIFSLTDHDLPPSLPAGELSCGDRTIVHVHGVELTASHENKEQHLLVYFSGEMPADFQDYCTQRSMVRAQRYDDLIEQLPFSDLDVAPEAAHHGKKSMTRLHLALDIVNKGHARNVSEAFSRWLSELTLSQAFPPMKELIQRSKKAGGFTAWAHPGLESAKMWTPELKEAGLDALEAYRPFRAKKYQKTVQEIARRNEIYVTGGSDYHGVGKPLGSFAFAAEKIRCWAEPNGFPGFLAN